MTPIEVLLIDWQPGHSILQMDRFITLRSGGTLYGCYFQSLREIATRWFANRDRAYSRGLLLVDIDELEAVPGSGFEKRRNEIRLNRKREELATFDRMAAKAQEELDRFHEQADVFRRALEHQGVKFPLDAETKHRLDCEMWEHNLKARCAVELMANCRIGNSTIELIQSCPTEMRSRIVESLQEKNHQALMAWFMEQDQGLIECSELSDSPRPSPRTYRMGSWESPPNNSPRDSWNARTARIGAD